MRKPSISGTPGEPPPPFPLLKPCWAAAAVPKLVWSLKWGESIGRRCALPPLLLSAAGEGRARLVDVCGGVSARWDGKGMGTGLDKWGWAQGGYGGVEREHRVIGHSDKLRKLQCSGFVPTPEQVVQRHPGSTLACKQDVCIYLPTVQLIQ